MDFTKGISLCFPSLSKFIIFSKENNQERINNSFSDKYAYYIFKFQSLVTWQNPIHSITCILIIQLIFWMIVNLCWRFYGIIFTLLLLLCAHDMWTEKIWPEIRITKPDISNVSTCVIPFSSGFLNSEDIYNYFDNFVCKFKAIYTRLMNLRTTHPLLFCSGLSLQFSFFIFIGSAISGMCLIHLILTMIFVLPGVYLHLLPDSFKTFLKECLITLFTLFSPENSDVNYEDEYIPMMSEERINEIYDSVFQLKNEQFVTAVDEDTLVPGLSLPSLKMNKYLKDDLSISNSSTVSSEVSENMKFQGVQLNNADDEFDTLDEDEDDEQDYSPVVPVNSDSGNNSQQYTLLNSIVSKFVLPDINQFRNIFSYSTSSLTAQQHCDVQYNTDEDFEIINNSDLN